jgi:hypothetical protein
MDIAARKERLLDKLEDPNLTQPEIDKIKEKLQILEDQQA